MDPLNISLAALGFDAAARACSDPFSSSIHREGEQVSRTVAISWMLSSMIAAVVPAGLSTWELPQ